MQAARTPPFCRPDPRAIQCSPWIMSGGRHLQDGDLIKEWDQSLVLTLDKVVQIDIRILASSGRLPVGTILALVPTWWSEGTGLRGSGAQIPVRIEAGTGHEELHVSMTIPGSQLAGQVRLSCKLVLTKQTASGEKDPLSVKWPGSILWEDALTLVLEGKGARFPITAVDFEASGLGPGKACWLLEWKPRDLHMPAMSCIRIYINSSHEAFHRAVTTLDPDDASRAIRSAMKFQVAEEMIRLALEEAEDLALAAPDLDKGSAGRVLLDLLGNIFPEKTLPQLIQWRAGHPGEFSAQLQDRLQLFGTGGVKS